MIQRSLAMQFVSRLLFACVVVAGLVAGCTTPTPPAPATTPTPPVPNGMVNVYRNSSQEIMDPVFASWFRHSTVRNSTTADGYRRVEAGFKNTVSTDLMIKYRFEWEKDGVPVVDVNHAAWSKKFVRAGEECVLTGISPEFNCCEFKLSVRLAQ